MTTTKQDIVNELVIDLQKGTERGEIVSKGVERWHKSERTIDRYLKIAKKQYTEIQQKGKDALSQVYVDTMLEAGTEAIMTDIEAKKLITDIARGNLTDYMIIKKVEFTPRIEVPLTTCIESLEQELKFEEEFAAIAKYSEKEIDKHKERQIQRERNIARLKLELSKNPLATKIIDGPVEWKEVAELDMVKLVADKEKGIVKSIANTQFGLKVEMYAADEALTEILKVHGSYAPLKVAATNKKGEDIPASPTINIQTVAILHPILESETE